ncbi:energy-coupling factor transporter transmembrane protein EcfT [Clostridium sp. YIM B02505]|uniref:Energy-coupling factor transporter transmembrane protein EcfT n=1 Tax=Clostridium yunnanense TaxID=2800325 RepID=A0ABS1ET15_9CLOT|nr:energy-coupling factor transporter transmembrane component T [Clostridium yunnanense]MBK1812531.1 energy-coupling factor transporter transmembrane protein EcfT [Clostridium yunnanense]
MLKEITIGQYIPGDSFIHKLDPRTKILISMLFIVSLFIMNKYVGYIFVTAFLCASIIFSQVHVRFLYKGLKPVFVLILITAALNIFMIQGKSENLLFAWNFLKVYKEGIDTAVFMTLRLIFLILGTSLLTLTTSPIELTDGIENLLNPFKKIGVPAHELAMMMTIALRFIPTLMDETDKIMKAQQARGADFESGNVIQKSKSLIPLLVPLFISSFRRADELAMAMEARCYRGGEGRTRMKQLKYEARDVVAYAIILALLVISFYVRFGIR